MLKNLPIAWRHALAWTVLAAAGAVLYAASYKTWGDPIIDLGRDLYVPSQILEGRILYREILYNYGPAAPYLLAGVTAVLGNDLWVFESVGLLIALAVLGALYVVGARLGGVTLGFAAAFLFLTLNAFAASTWGCNFVLPYSYAATLGTAFALWSFVFLQRHLDGDGRGAPYAWSVAFLFAALMAKQETGAGIAAVHAVAWATGRIRRRAIFSTLGAGIVAGALFLALFAARGPHEHALLAENLAKFAENPDPFFGVVAGVDRPGRNFLETLAAAGKLASIVLAAALGALAVRNRQKGPAWSLVAVVAFLLAAGLVWQWAHVRLLQATPLAALAVAGYCLVRDRKDPLLLLATFALFAGLRVVLQFHPLWYGFYLVVPSYPFVVYGLGYRLAGSLPRGRLVAVSMAVLGAVVIGRFEVDMWQAYQGKTSVVETPRGTMRGEPTGRLETIGDFLAYAELVLGPENPRLVVMPEGAAINYFTGLDNPTAYYIFTPPEIGSAAVERRMIRELEATRPEYLLMTSRDLAEFGARGIGIDYALELGEWIRGAYELAQIFETSGPLPWRLVLLRRRPTPQAQ